MKKEMIFCTIALTTVMLGGCASKNVKGSENNASVQQQTTDSQTTTNHQTTGQQTTNQQTTNQQTSTQHTTNQQTTDQQTTNQQTTTQSKSRSGQSGDTKGTMITEENAKKIALSHAGLTADQVTFIKSGLDRDDGHQNYDVEFYSKDKTEYDYEIDPYTGEVLNYDYDAEYYTKSSDTPNGDAIKEDDAKKIALDKVPGSTTKDIREFETDYENGRLHYEGKIYYDKKEYEFEIDGYTGDVLEWDVEPIYGGVV